MIHVDKIKGRTMVCLDPEDPEDAARLMRDIHGLHPDLIRVALRDIVRESRRKPPRHPPPRAPTREAHHSPSAATG